MSAFCQLYNVCRSMQEVQLDKNVRLLDSPGIVMATGDETSAHTILRNAVKVEQIEDPAAPVEIILSRCRKDQMMMQYKVRFFTSIGYTQGASAEHNKTEFSVLKKY